MIYLNDLKRPRNERKWNTTILRWNKNVSWREVLFQNWSPCIHTRQKCSLARLRTSKINISQITKCTSNPSTIIHCPGLLNCCSILLIFPKCCLFYYKYKSMPYIVWHTLLRYVRFYQFLSETKQIKKKYVPALPFRLFSLYPNPYTTRWVKIGIILSPQLNSYLSQLSPCNVARGFNPDFSCG